MTLQPKLSPELGAHLVQVATPPGSSCCEGGFRVTLTEPWHPDVWSNTVLGVSEGGFGG